MTMKVAEQLMAQVFTEGNLPPEAKEKLKQKLSDEASSFADLIGALVAAKLETTEEAEGIFTNVDVEKEQLVEAFFEHPLLAGILEGGTEEKGEEQKLQLPADMLEMLATELFGGAGKDGTENLEGLKEMLPSDPERVQGWEELNETEKSFVVSVLAGMMEAFAQLESSTGEVPGGKGEEKAKMLLARMLFAGENEKAPEMREFIQQLEVPKGNLDDSLPGAVKEAEAAAEEKKAALRALLSKAAEKELALLQELSEDQMSREDAARAAALEKLKAALQSGQLPALKKDGTLATQAALLLGAQLEEGKPLSELPGRMLQEMKALFLEGGLPEEKSGQERSFGALLSRAENFLRSFLGLKEKNPQAAQAGNFGGAQQGGENAEGKAGRGFGQAFMDHDLLNASSGRSQGQGSATTLPGMGNQLPFVGAREFPISQQAVLSQVMEKMSLFSRPGVQEMRLKLQPDFLGEVFIRVRQSRGKLTADIFTQSASVKELLETQLESLKQRFQQMDLDVEQFNVHLGGEEGPDGFPKEGHEDEFSQAVKAAGGEGSPAAGEEVETALTGSGSPGERRVDLLV